MALNLSDPRIYLAAERTLLAWVRTGITIMALGFVISRFGLFLQLIALQSKEASIQTNISFSAVLGALFIIVGSLTIFFAAIQQKRFIMTLPITDLPSGYSKRFAVLLALSIGVLGMVLAAYLLVTEI